MMLTPRTPKSPLKKKRLSLAKDRRNTYGENAKSSRKNIPLSKALSHRKLRHKAAELERKWDILDEESAEALELTVVTPRLQKGKFQKWPDRPLGEVLRCRNAKKRPAGAQPLFLNAVRTCEGPENPGLVTKTGLIPWFSVAIG